MKQLEILGTRLVINTSLGDDFYSDINSVTSGHIYADVITEDPVKNTISISTYKLFKPGPDQLVHWLVRKTSKSVGNPGILGDEDYKTVITVARMYAENIIQCTNCKHKITYFRGILESLICFSGDKNLIDFFYDSQVTMKALRDRLANIKLDISNRSKGVSRLVSQNYRRYSITELIEDLVKDKAQIIMDDQIYKYHWQGRKDTGYGNIKPIIESGKLYPTYQITGVQGNQTNANLSLKFDFKANFDTGSSIKLLEINRNLMVVQNGTPFQDMLALHVSKNLMSKLSKKGLIDSVLPVQGDIIIDIRKVPVCQRKTQRNRDLSFFSKMATQYNVCKKELEKLSSQIQWTPEEQARANESAAASKAYWNLNKDQMVSTKSGKRIFDIYTKSTGTWPTLSDKEARELRKKLLSLQEESYRTLCMMIFSYLVSKKSPNEYFGLGKRALVTGKASQYTTEFKSETGLTWTSRVKLL